MIEHHPDFYSIDTPMPKAGIEMGARLGVFRQSDGKLWIHAPLEITDADERDIRALGEIAFIVVPNNFHYLQVSDFARRFPGAPVYAPALLDDKLKDVPHEDLDISTALFAADFESLLFDTAPGFHEWVFLHRTSKTLILTDLSLNLAAPESILGKITAAVMDAGHGLAPSRPIRLDMALGDRHKTRALVDTLLGWDFDRISVAHGLVVESGGKEALRHAFEWLE